jgi:hypothetical protein
MRFNACVCARYVIIRHGQANPSCYMRSGVTVSSEQAPLMPDRIIAMLNRLGELISQSNFKQFHTAASDTYRSLHSFCNHSESGVWSLKSGVKSKDLLSGF